MSGFHSDYVTKTLKCPVCGKMFIVPSLSAWVYRKSDYAISGTGKILYFCTWSCMRKWEKAYEERIIEDRRKRKQEAAKKGHEKRKAASGNKQETADPERTTHTKGS